MWRIIATQDGHLTVGSRSVKFLISVLAFGVLLLGYLYPIQGTNPTTTAHFTGFVTEWITLVTPVIGILLGYNAVVSERESGSLKLSLVLPHSRKDIVLGKLLGRTVPLVTGLGAALILAGALVVYPFGELLLLNFAVFVLVAICYAILWVSIGLAVSISVSSKRRALVSGFAIPTVFVYGLDTIERAVRVGLSSTGVTSGELPLGVQFVFGMTPGRGFTRVVDGLTDPAVSVDGPWYLSEWTGLLAIGIWTVVPLGVGYRRFKRSDLH